jgi:hypothetical protein
MGTPEFEPMAPLTPEELEANRGTQLPDKQAMSVVPLIDTGSLLDGGPLLNLNLDLDLDADIAAPIDAALAANANVAVPIDAAVSANVLSGSAVGLASADQDSLLTQRLAGDAIASADQDVTLDQSRDDIEAVDPTPADTEAPQPSGALLDLNADLDLNLDLAAPIDAAIALNANVGAPIDAAVSANILSGGAQAIATAPQDSVVVQELEGTALANADQDAIIDQSDLDAEGVVADTADQTDVSGITAAAPVDTAPVDAAPIDAAATQPVDPASVDAVVDTVAAEATEAAPAPTPTP